MEKKRRGKGLLVVCSNCRRKKIKCDKGTPCGNCVRSNITEGCQYDGLKMKHFVMNPSNDDKVRLLQQQVQELQQIIASNHGKSTTTSPLSQSPQQISPSILDLKSDKLYMYSINMKPSGVQVVNSFRPTFTTMCIVEFKSLMGSNSSGDWKIPPSYDKLAMDDIPSPFQSYNGNDIDERLRNIFINNYYGILERLIYFQNELNELIFNSCIPCGVLHMVLNNYIRPSIDGIIFLPPKKLHEYQPLALILAVVDLVEIFTKYENVKPFSQLFVGEAFELSHIALDTLNFSKFRKRQTHFGLMAIITLRLTLIQYGHFTTSGFSHHVEYSYFQISINMAMGMGLNRDINKLRFFTVNKEDDDEVNFAKQIPFEFLKKLWNYLLKEDLRFSLFGPTPMISHEYSHGLYVDVADSKAHEIRYHNLILKSLNTLTNKDGCNLNDFIECCKGIRENCSTHVSFGDIYYIANNKKTWPEVRNKFYSLKIILELYSFAGYQSGSCGRARSFSAEQLSDPNNIIELDKIHHYFKTHSTIIYIYLLKFIKEVLSCNTHSMFIMYMRNLMWVFLILPSIGMINLSIEPGNHIKKGTMNIDVSLSELESLIFSSNEIPSDIVNYYSSPHILVGEILEVFKDVVNLPIMLSNHDFYTNARFCLVLICFLKAYNQFTSNGNFSVPDSFKSIPKSMVGIYEEMIQRLFLEKNEPPIMATPLVPFELDHPTPALTTDPLSEYMSATFADIDMFQDFMPVTNERVAEFTF